MIVLSFGYKKPQSGDRGSIWFPALEFDIQRLNDHDHEGVNSKKLASSAVLSVSQTLAVSWTGASGVYTQTVTMPSGLQYDTCLPSFRKTDTGEILYLSCVKAGPNTFTITTWDPTLDVTVIYTT